MIIHYIPAHWDSCFQGESLITPIAETPMQQFQPFFHMPQAKALLNLGTALPIIGNDDVKPARLQPAGNRHLWIGTGQVLHYHCR